MLYLQMTGGITVLFALLCLFSAIFSVIDGDHDAAIGLGLLTTVFGGVGAALIYLGSSQ